MFLASNAFQAGSLAASQPGLTIVDPLVASVLGAALFGERLDVQPWAVTGELVALITLVASVILLSRSPLVMGEKAPGPGGSVAPVPADAIPAAQPDLPQSVPVTRARLPMAPPVDGGCGRGSAHAPDEIGVPSAIVGPRPRSRRLHAAGLNAPKVGEGWYERVDPIRADNSSRLSVDAPVIARQMQLLSVGSKR